MRRIKKNTAKQTISYRHSDKRKNNPHVGMVDTTSGGVERRGLPLKTRSSYSAEVDAADLLEKSFSEKGPRAKRCILPTPCVYLSGIRKSRGVGYTI